MLARVRQRASAAVTAIGRAGNRWQLEFSADAAAFLAVAGDYLAAEPVINTVVATVAHHRAAQVADGIEPPARDWWLAVRDLAGTVCGAGMRTAPFPPYPLFLLPMPDEAAGALARVLHERGEEVLGINGARPAADICAAELARRTGRRVEVRQQTRLHELGELVPPTPVPGKLVAATEADLDLAIEWLTAFAQDADEQAGRPRSASPDKIPNREEVRRRIRDRGLWFWLNAAGERVHLTGVSAPSFGVARVGPVYTPPAERGRGWASNAVAEVSRRVLASGARVCLYTDQANPVSNKVYAALGYRPVVDMVNLAIA